MISKLPFWIARRGRFDEVAERRVLCGSPERSGFPLSQIVAHESFARLAKDKPRLPRRSGDDGEFGVFLVRELWPVPAPQGTHRSRDLAAHLESRCRKGNNYEVGKSSIARNNNVSPWHEHS